MFYDNILVFPSYGYRFITPIDWKNESSQVCPIIANKITEHEGIKVCYQILIYNTSFNIHFESVSILGHKFGYVYPLYHQQLQLKDSISSVIEQFELYTQNNITNNLSYFKYDINNIKLFTNDTYEGMKLYQESLNNLRQSLIERIERERSIDDRISDITNDRIEEQKLREDINREVESLFFDRCSGLETFKTTVSDISENGIKADLKKQQPINRLNMLETPYENIVIHNNTGEVDDINNIIHNIDENVKKIMDVEFIMHSAKHNSKYVYQGDNKWKPMRKANKDKLLNVDKEKTWKRI